MLLLSEILTSIGVVKILEELWLSEALGLTITEISKATGQNHARVNHHINFLKNFKILFEYNHGRIRLITFGNSKESLRIKEMLSNWFENQKVAMDVNRVTPGRYSINK
jgi:hypothetical protein